MGSCVGFNNIKIGIIGDMNFLHSNYYFPTQFKPRKLKMRERSQVRSAVTPDPLTVKKYEIYVSGMRPCTTQKVNRKEMKPSSQAGTRDKFADSFDYYIKNFAVTNLPPNEVIEHFNQFKKRQKTRKNLESVKNSSAVVYNNTYLPDDFTVLDFPKLENELFFSKSKKRCKRPDTIPTPLQEKFEIIGNPLSLARKKQTARKKLRLKSKFAGIQLKFPKVDLNTSFSFKSTLI